MFSVCTKGTSINLFFWALPLLIFKKKRKTCARTFSNGTHPFLNYRDDLLFFFLELHQIWNKRQIGLFVSLKMEENPGEDLENVLGSFLKCKGSEPLVPDNSPYFASSDSWYVTYGGKILFYLYFCFWTGWDWPPGWNWQVGCNRYAAKVKFGMNLAYSFFNF